MHGAVPAHLRYMGLQPVTRRWGTLRLRPLCADAAEWLSQKVDRCSLCFLLVAYTAILIAVLVA